MTKTPSSWEAISIQAEGTLQAILDATPTDQGVEIPPAYMHVLSMFWRARRLYEGVLVLAKARLPEESGILGRSLFEESLRLQQIAADEDEREALILGWANKSIQQTLYLLEDAQSCGLDDDVSELEAALAEERRNLQAYGQRHDVGRYRSFTGTRELAFRFGREEDFWTYEWTHRAVHGGATAWMYAARQPEPNRIVFDARTDHPVAITELVCFAARSLTEAAAATFSILDWSFPSAVRSTLQRLEQRADETVG